MISRPRKVARLKGEEEGGNQPVSVKLTTK